MGKIKEDTKLESPIYLEIQIHIPNGKVPEIKKE
jgi:hypothetical protein